METASKNNSTILAKPRQSSLLSDSAIYLVSNMLNAGIPFALLPILTRLLSPTEYGEIAMFQTFFGALGAIVGLNVVGASNRKHYDLDHARGDMRDFIGACLQILLFSTAATLVVVWCIQDRLSSALALETKWLYSAILMAAASVVVQIRLGQWQVQRKARQFGVMQVAQSACNVGLSLLLVVALQEGAGGRMVAQVATMCVFSIVSLLLLRRDTLLRAPNWKPSLVREALCFGIPLVPHIAGGFLLTAVDRLVIKSELNLAEAGIYMVAVQLSMAMSLGFDALNKAYVPWLFEQLKRDDPATKVAIVRYTYIWFLCIVAIGVGAFVIGRPAVSLLAGKEYAKAGSVIGWLAIGQGFNGMYLMVTNYIFYSKRTGALSTVTLFTGVLNVVLLIALTRELGLPGAATAFCISMAVRFLLTWRVAQVRHPMPWFSFANRSGHQSRNST